MSDVISEIEHNLASFTECLSSGIKAVSEQTLEATSVEKARLVNEISFNLASIHKNILGLIDKMPEEMLGESRRQQELEIEELQREYQQVTTQLERAQTQAGEVTAFIKKSLEEMKTA